jgi:hypothetical protein
MEDQPLVMDGKAFISSAQAARLVGYTKDYVGQLCRAGKLDAKLIGRSWYVSEESITQHKLSVHYTLTQPKKTHHTQEEPKAGTAEKASVHIENSPPPKPQTTDELPVYMHGYRAHTQGAGHRGTLAGPVGHAVSDHTDTPSFPRMISTHDPLVHADIRYEDREPLYFEDDRPTLPSVSKPARFEGVPIGAPEYSVPPRQPEGAHPHAAEVVRDVALPQQDTLAARPPMEHVPDARRSDVQKPSGVHIRRKAVPRTAPHQMHATESVRTVPVDGVRNLGKTRNDVLHEGNFADRTTSARPTRSVMRQQPMPGRPMPRRNERLVREDDKRVAETVERRPAAQGPSKVVPVLGAVLVFLLFLLWYFFVRT